MKCPTCGEEVVDLARCENCGTPMPTSENIATQSADQKPNESFSETSSGENDNRQIETYSFDQDLEFADADALLDDKSKPADEDENMNSAGQDMPPAAGQPVNMPNVISGPASIVYSPQAVHPAETHEPVPSQPQPPSPEIDREMNGHGNMQTPPIQNSATNPIPPAGTPENRSQFPTSGNIGNSDFQNQQAPQTFQTQPPPQMEGPASIVHQNRGFSSFVQPEQPQQNISSPFVESAADTSADLSSYDFQPSIYYKQALGEPSGEIGYHRETSYGQRTDIQSETSKDDGYIPPSFARSLDNQDIASLPRQVTAPKPYHTQSGFQTTTARMEDFQNKNRTNIISILFQAIFILLTASSFFLMDILPTLSSSTNPYDQLKSRRLLVFVLITVSCIVSLLIKNLSGKLYILIPLMLVITGLFLYGTTSLRIMIKPDKTGNFFILNPGNPATIVEDDSFDAVDPVISPTGTKALFAKSIYNAETSNRLVDMIEFKKANNKMESSFKDTQLAVNGNFQWFDDNSILFSDLRIELPSEMNNPVLMASKNELYFDFTSTFDIFIPGNETTAQHFQFTSKLPFSLYLKQIVNKSENTIMTQLSKIYTSPDKAEYYFTFNRKTGMIAACYMGGIWLIDPATGVSKKITRGGDIGYPYLDTWPKFNKDGNKILFVRTRIGDKIENDILQLDVDTALKAEEPIMPASVTNDNYNYINFALSPGGRFLAAWIYAYQEAGAKKDEAALVLFDMKLNKHIKIYPLGTDYRTAEQFVSNIDWSQQGNFILIQVNRLLHSSIKRIEVPEEISKIDQR